MKKVTNLLLTGIIILCLSSCSSGVSQKEYDSLQSYTSSLETFYEMKKNMLETSQEKYDVLLETNKTLSNEKSILEDQVKSMKEELDNINSELLALSIKYDEFKVQMKPYVNLSIAEAEAKTAEAELLKAESEKTLKEQLEAEKSEKEEAEKKAAEEKAKKEAEGYETGITYDQLARTPDKYTEEKVKFSGKVIQVLEGNREIQIRLAVNSDYDKILYCKYKPSIISSRILDGDIITVYGKSIGLISYESAFTTITIPGVSVEKIDQ